MKELKKIVWKEMETQIKKINKDPLKDDDKPSDITKPSKPSKSKGNEKTGKEMEIIEDFSKMKNKNFEEFRKLKNNIKTKQFKR